LAEAPQALSARARTRMDEKRISLVRMGFSFWKVV